MSGTPRLAAGRARPMAVARPGATALRRAARTGPGLGVGLPAPARAGAGYPRGGRDVGRAGGGAHASRDPRARDRPSAELLPALERRRAPSAAAGPRRLLLRMERAGTLLVAGGRRDAACPAWPGATRSRWPAPRRWRIAWPSIPRRSIAAWTARSCGRSREASTAAGSRPSWSARSRAIRAAAVGEAAARAVNPLSAAPGARAAGGASPHRQRTDSGAHMQ